MNKPPCPHYFVNYSNVYEVRREGEGGRYLGVRAYCAECKARGPITETVRESEKQLREERHD